MKKTYLAALGMLLATLSAPSWAIPIVGSDANNSGVFDFSVQSVIQLRVTLANTSSYDARVTGFGFDIDGGLAVGLWSVYGTLDDDAWGFSFDAIPGSGDRDAFAITGANLWNGSASDGIETGGTGIFDFAGLFKDNVSVSNIVVRFDQTGANHEGTDKAYACAAAPCGNPTGVGEPATLALIGLGVAIIGVATALRRRRS